MKKITLFAFLLSAILSSTAQEELFRTGNNIDAPPTSNRGTFPSPYCGPLEFNFDVEPITLVSVADINNVTDAAVDGTPAHEDFTTIVGNMEPGVDYDIALEGNTGGGFTNRFIVFVDWNQNDILDDAGEVYEILETILGSTGTDGQQATGVISVPEDALTGETRMRVKKIFGLLDFMDPCLGAGFGQAEDYTVNISSGDSLECGGLFVDSGGISAPGDAPVDTGYQNNENLTFTILPDNPGEVVTVTFTYVDIETAGGTGVQDGCWDFLTVYDGPDTSSPVLAATLCGEESGDGSTPSVPESLLSVGDSFTSTHPSGALTWVFTSDGSVPQTGWEADITCEQGTVECEAAENFMVSNVLDTTADMTWDEAPTANDGYQAAVYLQGADPTVAAPVYISAVLDQTTTSDTATGLSAEIAYDAYLFTICDLSATPPLFELSGPITFNTILNTTVFETDTLAMYPNPTNGMVTLRANVSIETLEVYNILGQVVINRAPNVSEITLDVSSLQSGTYFVKATAEGVTTTQKLIKR